MRRGCSQCGEILEEWESGICEGCQIEDDSPKLSRHQSEILRHLETGGKLRSEISGWYYKGRLLRAETEDALRATGKVKVVEVVGKKIKSRYVVLNEG
jgi:RNA:NAD 2'-phosphotransferase (TPT1/KptA family)